MVLQLENLHPLARLVFPDEVKARLLERIDKFRVDLITVPMPLLDDLDAAVQGPRPGPLGALLEDGLAQAETHCAAHILPVELGHVDDDAVLGLRVELFRRGFGHTAHVPRELGGSHLEAKADLTSVSATDPRSPLRAELTPRKGMSFSLAHLETNIIPSVPRWPKPPGTMMPDAVETSCQAL